MVKLTYDIFKWGVFARDFCMLLFFARVWVLVVTELRDCQMTCIIFEWGMYTTDILYDFTLCYRGLLFVIAEQ